ncbi:hypothetical protein Gpo141_00011352 [Globisporangium polare]
MALLPPSMRAASGASSSASTADPAGAFERTLRVALEGSSSQPSAVLSALLADAKLMRDAQALFDQIVPRASPLSSGSSAASSLSAERRAAVAAGGGAMPPSPFSSAFARLGQREGAGPDANEKLSALAAVVATGVTREIQQEKRQERALATGNAVVSGEATSKRKRQHEGGLGGDYAGKNGKRPGEELEDDSSDDDAVSSSRPTWDLIALLTDANVSFSAFLRHFTSLFDRLLLNPELLEVATQLKEEFTIATVLYEKYRVLWKKLVPPVATGHVHEPRAGAHSHGHSHTDASHSREEEDEVEREREPEQQRTPPPRVRKMSDVLLQQLVSVDRHQQLHDAGWLLFLIAKRRLSGQYAGLGQLYYLLLAVLHLVLSNLLAPSVEAEVAAALSALGAAASSTNGSGHASSEDMNNVKILDALCANPKVDQHEVTRATVHLDQILLQMREVQDFLLLPQSSSATAVAAATASGGGFARWFAAAVLNADVIPENLSRLSKYYKNEFVDGCGKLDERFYLDAAAHQIIMGPKPVPAAVSSHPPLTSSGNSSALSSPVLTKRPARSDRLMPPNPFSSPVRTPQRRDSNASIRGTSTPSGTHASGTQGPPPSPFTRQAWQFNGSSPPPSTSLLGSRAAMHTPNTRAFLHTATTHRDSPFVAQTPVTAAVETSNWVRDTLSSADGFVSPTLERFFKECTNDPTGHIASIMQELSQKLMRSRRRALGLTPTPNLGDENENTTQQQVLMMSEYSEVDGSLQKIKNLAVALFYSVLEALLLSERDRLRTTNFSSLLNNETFVSSLYACSLEVVLKAHSLITLSFPFLLDILGVNAFDFGKIVESFVKHTPKLPNVLKRHMRDLEQTILDSLAWRSDSGLYVVLTGDSKPSSTESSLLASLTNGTPATGNTSSANARTSVLQLFFRKVLSLAASRIFRLGNLLELDAKYLNQVWTAIKECISSHHSLLKDRHLDQVILCSLYGVCKVNHVRPEVTFKRVLDSYKKLHSFSHPGAVGGGSSTPISLTRNSNDVIRNIKLDDDSRGDIIKFYNRCYIPTMKVFMLQFQVVDKQMAAADAVVASATGTNASASQAPPGFTPRQGGSSVVASSTSDTEIVAEAAAAAVEKVMKAYGLPPGPGTPNRPARRGSGLSASPRMISSPISSLQMFSTSEVQPLPVSVHQTSPKRVLASNIYMSPLQQSRLHHRSHLTPRSHALYAFGESPSRDLALINRAVNTSMTRTRVMVPPPLVLTESHEEEEEEEETSESNSAASTPTNSVAQAKRRRVG